MHRRCELESWDNCTNRTLKAYLREPFFKNFLTRLIEATFAFPSTTLAVAVFSSVISLMVGNGTPKLLRYFTSAGGTFWKPLVEKNTMEYRSPVNASTS